MGPRWARDRRWSGSGRASIRQKSAGHESAGQESARHERPVADSAKDVPAEGSDAEFVGVGDVRLVRTFRVGADGGLSPVNSATAWADGWSTATCLRDRTHRPPEAHCRCGFYAYSDPAYVMEQLPARQVLAVVATHGTMEAGTRGARVAQARVEAIWFGERVSEQLAAVRRRHPSVAVYRDRAAMGDHHPLTILDYFRPPHIGEAGRRRLRAVMWSFLTLVTAVGCVPAAAVVSTAAGAVLWLSLLAAGMTTVLTGIGQRSAVLAVQGVGAVGWLVTANPTTGRGWAGRIFLVLMMAWVMRIWWRAATPGRRVRAPRLERFFRRARGQLPGPG